MFPVAKRSSFRGLLQNLLGILSTQVHAVTEAHTLVTIDLPFGTICVYGLQVRSRATWNIVDGISAVVRPWSNLVVFRVIMHVTDLVISCEVDSQLLQCT